jgi:hypothetical protein
LITGIYLIGVVAPVVLKSGLASKVVHNLVGWSVKQPAWPGLDLGYVGQNFLGLDFLVGQRAHALDAAQHILDLFQGMATKLGGLALGDVV